MECEPGSFLDNCLPVEAIRWTEAELHAFRAKRALARQELSQRTGGDSDEKLEDPLGSGSSALELPVNQVEVVGPDLETPQLDMVIGGILAENEVLVLPEPALQAA
jgi:hypothetical protein